MRELRKWLLALVLIIAGGIVSFAVVLTWMEIRYPSWDAPDAMNLPPLELVVVLTLLPLMVGTWLVAAMARALALLIRRGRHL